MNELKFSDLAVGDMFNTKYARFVKINIAEAIMVIPSLGKPVRFYDDEDIVVLYSSFNGIGTR